MDHYSTSHSHAPVQREILRFPVHRILLIATALILAGCQESQGVESKTRVLIGGTLIASSGAAPIEDSIVVIVGGTIRAAGLRKDIPVPQDSQRADMQGKWLVPAGTSAVAEGQPANLNVLDHAPRSPDDAPVRRMIAGNWAQ